MAAPTFLAARSTGATDAGGNWGSAPTVDFAATGNVVVLQILQDGSTSGAVAATAFNNIRNLASTNNTMNYLGEFPVGSPTAAYQHLWIGRVGTTSAISVSVTGTNSTSEDLYHRWYEFGTCSTGTTLATVIENSTAGSTANEVATSATAADAGVTTLGPDRLALNFIAVNDDNTITEFTGETGGDWTLAVAPYAESSGTDGAIGLQIATITTAATIDGGTGTITDSDAWGVVGFALIGTTVVDTTRLPRYGFVHMNDPGIL